MIHFTTHVQIPKPDFSIDYLSPSLFMGSCFADNVGGRMQELKFPVVHNPFGVVYNPLSLAKQLDLLLNKEVFTTEDLGLYNELWFSYMHYTKFSDPDPQRCVQKINAAFEPAKEMIKQAEVLFLTFGTAFVYQLKSTGEIVANCHKIPSKEFGRRVSGVDEIVKTFTKVIDQVRVLNSRLKIVLTVSPIRHWKDGAVQNQRSKAILLLAAKELEETIPDVFYFPAYEVFMDELRDYRFYAEDMLHPSETAIKYLWGRFQDTFFEASTLQILNEVEKLLAGFRHRPLHRDIQTFQRFSKSLTDRAEEICQKYPCLDFEGEIRDFHKNV